MIITRAPFRVSFAGGGSDLPAYYRGHRGAVLSVTMNKYMYISIHPYFERQKTHLKYSKVELVNSINEVQHPIFREVLNELLPEGGVEIVSTADIPSGTGLGSSSTFAVALLLAVHSYCGKFRSKEELAKEACEVEISKLKDPIGKQDQYAAAYGGLNLIEFNTDDTVSVTPVILKQDVIRELEDNLLLFYTGDQRSAKVILADQQKELAKKDKIFATGEMVKLAHQMTELLIKEDLDGFGESLHKGWLLKRGLSSKISNQAIDKHYQKGISAGALGGKLLGAGGGGFLLFYCNKKHHNKLRKALNSLYELNLKFDWGGAQILYVGDRLSERGFI